MFLCLLGEVFDSAGKAKYHISGTWDEKIERTVVGQFCSNSHGFLMYQTMFSAISTVAVAMLQLITF